MPGQFPGQFPGAGPTWLSLYKKQAVSPGAALPAPEESTGPLPGVCQRTPTQRSRAVTNSIVTGRGDRVWQTPAGCSTGTAVPLSRMHWQFQLAGTPALATYFVIPQASWSSVSPGDIFFAYYAGGNAGVTGPLYGGRLLGGPFTVTTLSAPFAGFINVSFTPAAPNALNGPSVAIEGPQIPYAAPTPPCWQAQVRRSSQQISRAKTGNTGAPGDGVAYPGPNQSGPSGTAQPRATVAVPRRAVSRAVLYGKRTFGVQPVFSGIVPPKAMMRVPRRYPARAVPVAGGILVQIGINGQIQPMAVVPGRRRVPSRAVWDSNVGPPLNPAGSVQPRATSRLPRRYPARVFWDSNIGTGALGPAGQVQPRPTVVTSRRYPARVIWHAGIAQAEVPGRQQPRTASVAVRRYPYRAVIRGSAPQVAYPNGQVQPRATVPEPRRASSRVIWRIIYGLPAPAPAGTIQPRATVQVPRRTGTRAVWHGLAVPGARSSAVTGGLVRRRHAARGTWGGISVPPVTAHAVTGSGLVRRRATSRAVWHGATGIAYLNGTVPPYRLLPRRYPARGLWHWQQGTVLPPNGSVQPRCTVPVPRRASSRAVCRWLPVPPRTGSPVTGGLVRRRGTYRGVVFHVAGPANAHGPSGSQPGGVIRRRTSARAVYHTPPGNRGRLGPSVFIDFTAGIPQAKWIMPRVQARWQVTAPMPDWTPGVTQGTMGPGG